MKTEGKFLNFVFVMFFVFCSLISLFLFSFKVLEIPLPALLASLPLPGIQWGNIVMMIIVIAVADVLGIGSGLGFARFVRKPVYRFFDKRWKPKKGKGDTYTTQRGEKLEGVFVSSTWTDTIWHLISKSIPRTFVAVCLISLVITIFLQNHVLVGAIAAFVLPILPVSWIYLVREWRRLHKQFIVFTKMTFYISFRTPFWSLIFGRMTLPKSSKSPMNKIGDLQTSADPEDFDPDNRTGFIQDVFLSWLANNRGLRSVFIRSFFHRADEAVMGIEHANELNKLIDTCSALKILPDSPDPETYDIFWLGESEGLIPLG